MTHANAALTPRHRLKVAQLVVDQGWPISEVAARFQVSWPTVKRWADRYRTGQSMQDRSSRPHHSPSKTDQATTKHCIQLRLRLRDLLLELRAVDPRHHVPAADPVRHVHGQPRHHAPDLRRHQHPRHRPCPLLPPCRR